MMDAELLAAAARTELDRQAARTQLISAARKLTRARRRARRRPRDWSVPLYRRQTPGLDMRESWARLI